MSSTTATDLKRTFAISFDGQSQVSGNVYSDTVNFGGLVATEQGLGVATSYRGLDVDTFPADGILGMAFPEISTTKTLPLVNSLIGQGQMDEAAFSFKFANDGGELFLGGANPDLYTGDFTYLPVTKQEFWTVQADGLEMGGKTVISNFGAVIDTLSTAIVLTKEQAATFMNVTGAKNESSELGAGFLSFPCKKMPSLSLSITLGGVSFPINPGTLNMGLVSQGNENCVAGITIAQNDDPDAIIGLAFLRNVYTKFDAGNSRVGFAHLA
ncbi:hypothetical protein BGZ73_001383 [Actinomortierella ambigua]|nr:hypothetical protein BGZ73_001383 [Actinomortierella ambigua]